MRLRRRNFRWLIVAFVGSLAWGGIIYGFSPDRLPALAGFFFSLFIASFSLLTFLFVNMRRSLFISAGLVLWLILRSLGLRNFLYPLLLVALLITLELATRKR